MDYINAVLSGHRKSRQTSCRHVNAAARVVTCTRKFDRGLYKPVHTQLNCLEVPERVTCGLSVMVHRCLNGRVPQYLSTYSVPRSLQRPPGNICVLLLVISRRHRLTASVRMVVGLFSKDFTVLPAQCTPARSSAMGMSHTCLCLPSYNWYSFTDPGGMEG